MTVTRTSILEPPSPCEDEVDRNCDAGLPLVVAQGENGWVAVFYGPATGTVEPVTGDVGNF